MLSLSPFSFSSSFLPVEVDSNMLPFFTPDALSPSPAFFLSLYFILDITTHHAVLFLCCLKILLPSLCVSVASVSRIQLYSFDQREFPTSSRFSERLWCLRHPSITSSFPRSSQQPRVELRPQSAMFDDCSCRSSISRTL